MGFESRDYVRPSHEGWSAFPSDVVVTKRLVFITIGVFLAQVLSNDAITQWLALDLDWLMKGQIWRVVTYAFCHDTLSIWHIVFNMLFLWWFGATLERMYGSREFLAFYLVTAAISGLCFVGLEAALRHPFIIPVVGASGAISGLLVLYAMHFPRQKIYLFGFIPVEIWLLATIYLVADLMPVVRELAGQNVEMDGVAHAAHLGGMAFGFAYQHWNLRLLQLTSSLPDFNFKRRLRNRKRQQTVKLHTPHAEPEPERPRDLDNVDDILRKIYEHGEASLTKDERETLRAASSRLKNRMKNR